MGAKMGRPTEDPKVIQIRTRMSKSQKDMLEYCAARLNCTKTDVIISGISRIYEELKEK